MWWRVFMYGVWLVAWAGCGGEPLEAPSRAALGLDACVEQAPAPPAAPPTFWADVQPVLQARCAGCHADGGPGGISFDTWEQAHLLRDAIAASVLSRRMPPWPPSACCNTYRHDPSLSAEEIGLLAAWAAAGGPPDLVLTPPAAWTPAAAERRQDVVRCYALPWPSDVARYVVGFEVSPGAPAVVHHALVHAVTGREAERMRALDAADSAPGWDCFGQAVSLMESAGLGGWAPGYGPVRYPAGLGFAVEPGATILLQVHYHFASRAAHQADQTALRFWLADAVERPALSLGAANPLWLLDGGMRIPAGDADVRHRVWVDPIETLTDGRPFEIHGVSLHMHRWGVAGTIAVQRADGAWECLLREDHYDSNWQGQYFLSEPVTVYPGDRVYVECQWDNSVGNQPEGEAPRALDWGTDKEMCTGFLLGAAR